MVRMARLNAATKRCLNMAWAVIAVGILLAACDDNTATSVKLTKSNTLPPQYVTKFSYVTTWGGSWVYAYTVNTTTGLFTSVPGTFFSTGGSGIRGVAVDALGKFVFTANFTTNNVSAFTIDPASGIPTLVTGSPFPSGTNPNHVTVHPNGKFLYAVNSFNGAGGNSVSAYTINGTTGSPSQITGSPFAAGVSPFSLSIDPTGKYAYVAAGSGVHVFAIDGLTGSLAQIVGSPFVAGATPQGVAVHPGGKFAYVANSSGASVSAFAINAATGALAAIGTPVTTGTNPTYVVVNPAGTFAYVINASGTITTFTIDTTTGTLTSFASTSTLTLPTTGAIDPSGNFLYVVSQFGTEGVTGYTIGTDGSLTAIPGFPLPGSNSWGVAVARGVK